MAKQSPPRAAYHHGNLVEALIAATIGLIEEKGLEAVSVREAASGPRFARRAFPAFRQQDRADDRRCRAGDGAAHPLRAAGTSRRDPAMPTRWKPCGRSAAATSPGRSPTRPTSDVIASRTLIDFIGSPALRARRKPSASSWSR